MHPIRTFRSLLRPSTASGISPFKALSLALAGTLGVGNIAGVATALYLGGPGAVFWMIFSALVAMVLKYAEICLALRHKRYDKNGQPEGGAPYYIQDGFTSIGWPKLGKCLGWIFAFFCLINTFTMGSMLQVNAVAGALQEGFGIPLSVTGIALAFFTLFVVKGGATRIAALTEKLVPLMTLVFLGLCSAVLVLRYYRIGDVVYHIFADAFDVSSVGGGILGFVTSSGVRYGVMRGLVSNEAGSGTAPMAHATADHATPASQGVLGLIEVFVDTVLLCSVTALAILVSDSGPDAFGEDGVRTAQTAFSSVLGDWAGWLFALSIMFFGVATILCWAHYGQTALRAIFRGHRRLNRIGATLFPWMYSVTVIAGAVIAPARVWQLADDALAVMTIMNLLVLFMMHKEVAEETEHYISPHKVKEIKGGASHQNRLDHISEICGGTGGRRT